MEQAALLGMEQALNQVIGLDARAASRLAEFHGSVIGVELLGLGLSFCFVPDQRGRLQVLSSADAQPDCQMRGAPLDLARAMIEERKEDALFSGRIEILGNTDLAHRFSEILAGLDVDWEEQLAAVVGDVVAHETGKATRSAGRWASRTGRLTEQNLQEYLQEEARLLPTRFEVEEWQDKVDRLRDDVERLEARIKRLTKKTKAGGKPQ